MDKDHGKSGCDLKAHCGFYCRFLYEGAVLWKLLVEKFCDGEDHPLCARKIYFTKTGECAPLDITPIGTLPETLLAAIYRRDD
jgi:hypothetical protein